MELNIILKCNLSINLYKLICLYREIYIYIHHIIFCNGFGYYFCLNIFIYEILYVKILCINISLFNNISIYL
mgnify:CR=1 FL=1